MIFIEVMGGDMEFLHVILPYQPISIFVDHVQRVYMHLFLMKGQNNAIYDRKVAVLHTVKYKAAVSELRDLVTRQ